MAAAVCTRNTYDRGDNVTNTGMLKPDEGYQQEEEEEGSKMLWLLGLHVDNRTCQPM